ncbi:MAG: M24 family metallopeptidase [Rhodospirillales bacterium]|nr:M24 family metallopeptidase [Rhodospirillales bacterium]
MSDADRTLVDLLKEVGSRLDQAALDNLIAGVAAAPPALDGDAWLALISDVAVDDLPAELKRRLNERLAAARDRAPGPPAADAAGRIDALRRELRRRRLAGFVVPKTDQHQSEYLPACSERLAWLTGFTGTAGTAIVMRDRAALFVDGRYTLQAAGQVAPDLYEVCHVTGETMGTWIAAHLGKGARLGFDPWLQSQRQAELLRAACRRRGARLVAVEDNPVDAIWQNRPLPPIAPVVPHGEAFAPLFMAFAVIHADATAEVFVDPRKLLPEVRSRLGNSVRFSPAEAFAAALDRLGSERKQVRIDPERAPEAAIARLRKAGARPRLDADPCLLPKARKNAVELAGIRAAHRRDGVALCRFLTWLAAEAPKGWVSELDAAERLSALRSDGAFYRGDSFPTIAGAGANGAIVHYRADLASNRRLEPGLLFLLDSGGQYLDGTTDVTRTVAIGEPTEEMRTRFTQVLKGHIAVATARFPRGTLGSQLDVLARKALWAEGLDYDHGTGHGVGHYLCVHEGPQGISKLASRAALEPGMIVSNEPGYYKPSCYGIRIENLVAVVALANDGETTGADGGFLGFETLTLAPIDRSLIVPSLLDEGETLWLDRYHAGVREALTGELDAVCRDWLGAATRPLGG